MTVPPTTRVVKLQPVEEIIARRQRLRVLGLLADGATLGAPGPQSNWWAMLADTGAKSVIPIGRENIPGHVLLGLVSDDLVAATPLPLGASLRMDGGDDLDIATHRYEITPAGKAYLEAVRRESGS